jgi:rod shape-determining protein MreC
VLGRKHFIRGFIYLGVFALGWWFLSLGVRAVVRIIAFEFQSPVWSMASRVEGIWDFVTFSRYSKGEIFEKFRDLMQENAYNKFRIKEMEAIIREQEALLKFAHVLKRESGYRYEVSRVILREIDAWNQQLVIGKGRLHGIRENAAVIADFWVVGRVKHVYLATSVVELVSSVGFRLIAQFEGDERSVLYYGIGGKWISGGCMGEVKEVPLEIVFNEGHARRLVTSSVGGIFPEGLTVGWVNTLTKDPQGLFQSGEVLLPKQLGSVRDVAVLMPLSEK